ncbi:sortase A [Sarcina sp. DSM 11001]|uniref:class C sortase n=1 Tax=Sarcina sp. DSM 11001 TaxID=1798184 RepID=UPI0008823466|nr:class C sortase [Sarcina sp. DSM 11001]SDL80300.1 sortase A [Sarcina sp. DSM 11001]
MHSIFSWLKRNIVNVILTMILLTGVGLIAYPTVSDWYNSYNQSVIMIEYAEAIASMDPEVVRQEWERAERYNKEIVQRYGNNWAPDEKWIAAYMQELSLDEKGVMGYIQIPKFDLKIPVYHTTNEKVLQKGIGHMSGTSLPIGGEGTHAVLSGHRGLPTARLFTDLDQLVVGDKFQLNILDKTLAYEVDQIRIVEPDDFSDLIIQEDKDLCTLFTCTPYGINTHRLLVRGHRIKTANGSVNVPSDAMQYEPVLIAPFFASPVLLLGLIWLMVTTSNRRRLRRSREKALSEVMKGTGTVVSGPKGKGKNKKK